MAVGPKERPPSPVSAPGQIVVSLVVSVLVAVLVLPVRSQPSNRQGEGPPGPARGPVLPQSMRVGPMRVEMGRPVRLVMNLANRENLFGSALRVAHALAPATPGSASTSTTAPLAPIVHWDDPEVGPREFVPSEGVAEIPVPVGRPRVARLFVTWKPADGRFEMRVPGSPGAYEAKIVEPQASAVVEGTGSACDLATGPSVPIRVQIRDPVSVRSVKAFVRSTGAEYVTTAMARLSGDEREGRWETRIPRGPTTPFVIEYYVEITNVRGERSLYGDSSIPYRVEVMDPVDTRAIDCRAP